MLQKNVVTWSIGNAADVASAFDVTPGRGLEILEKTHYINSMALRYPGSRVLTIAVV